MQTQEIADRLEIQDLLIDYCTAVDQRDFAVFDEIFTPDAHFDCSAMGAGGRVLHGVKEIKSFLTEALAIFPTSQHMIANIRIRISADQAQVRSICHNPMVVQRGEDAAPHVMLYGLWYVDQLSLTANGWRINKRVLERCYDFNVPQDFQPVASSQN